MPTLQNAYITKYLITKCLHYKMPNNKYPVVRACFPLQSLILIVELLEAQCIWPGDLSAAYWLKFLRALGQVQNPNVWTSTEIFIQQEANARRSYFVHTSGRDQRANTGRKQRSLDSAGRIGFLAGSYGQMSRMDYIKQIASVL